MPYDIVSQISKIILTSDVNCEQVFNDFQLLSKGNITIGLPHIIVSMVANVEDRITCPSKYYNATIQLTIRDQLDKSRRRLFEMINLLKALFASIAGRYEFARIYDSILVNERSDNGETEYQIRRYDLDYTIAYSIRG